MHKFKYTIANVNSIGIAPLNHIRDTGIVADTIYKLATDNGAIEAKRNIKNVLIDSFYEELTQAEDTQLMDWLYDANNLFYYGNKHVSIAIKGGGALRIYNDMFMNSIKTTTTINYVEKISDIDVNLESNLPIQNVKEHSVRMLEWIKTTKHAAIYNIVSSKMKILEQKMKTVFIDNQTAYLPHMQQLYGINVISYELVEIKFADKKLNTMLMRNDQDSYIVFTEKLLNSTQIPNNKPDSMRPFDITFNDNMELCKAAVSSFSLARFRVCINMKFKINFKDVVDAKEVTFPGCIELYDLGISNSNQNSAIFKNTNDYLEYHEMVKHYIGTHEYDIYSLQYNIHDLINVIYSQSIFPWDDKKYAKRINRILHYCAIYDLTCKSLDHVKDNVKLTFDVFNKSIKDMENTQINFGEKIRNIIMSLFITHKSLAYRGSSFQYLVEENIQLFIMILYISNNMSGIEAANYIAYLKFILGPNKCNKSAVVAGDLNKITNKKLDEMSVTTYGKEPRIYDPLFKIINDNIKTYLSNIIRLLSNPIRDPDTESVEQLLNKLVT